jgi:hypothetical protein
VRRVAPGAESSGDLRVNVKPKPPDQSLIGAYALGHQRDIPRRVLL